MRRHPRTDHTMHAPESQGFHFAPRLFRCRSAADRNYQQENLRPEKERSVTKPMPVMSTSLAEPDSQLPLRLRHLAPQLL